MFILFLIVQKEKKCLKHKVFLHNTGNYCLYMVNMFSLVLCSDDDHDFEALKVTEVPSELRI